MGFPSSRILLFHRFFLLPPLVLLTLTCLYTSSTFTPFSTGTQHLSFLQGMQCISCESSSSLTYRSFLSRTLSTFPTSQHIRGIVSGHDVHVDDSKGEAKADGPVSRLGTDEVESVDGLEINENNVRYEVDSSGQETTRGMKPSLVVADEETSVRIVGPQKTSLEETPAQQERGEEEETLARVEELTNSSRPDVKLAKDSKVNRDAVSGAGAKDVDVESHSEKKQNLQGSKIIDDVESSVPAGNSVHSSVETAQKTSLEETPVKQERGEEEETLARVEVLTNPSRSDVKLANDSKVIGDAVSGAGAKDADVEIQSEQENFQGSRIIEKVESSVPAGKNVYSSVETVQFPSESKENFGGNTKKDLRLESTPLTSDDHSRSDEHAHSPIEKSVSITEAVPAPPPSKVLEVAESGYEALSEHYKGLYKITDRLAKSGLPTQSVNSTNEIDIDVNVPLRGQSRQGVRLPERSCEGRHVYVYTLPSKFNVDLAGQCDSVFWFSVCDYFINQGMGPNVPTNELNDRGEKVLVPDGSWFLTHQYALELIFHSRLMHNPCLTTDVNQADLLFVPYYGGLDVARYQFRDGVTNEQRDELMLELMSWLEGQDSWSRNNGVDHVFVLGKIAWDFLRVPPFDWGNRLLRLPSMDKPTTVLIERDAWNEQQIGVPHPTFFHPKDDNEIRTWLAHVEQSERRHLVSFAGMPRPNMFGNVRGNLIQQCLDNKDDCSLLRCVNDTCMRPDQTMNLFLHSHFCMQPPGDSSTRRSVFDSLVGGCIPVLFDPLTAYIQYPWHLPRNMSSYSVFVPIDNVISGKADIVRILKTITPEERTAVRTRIIREIIPGLLYSHPSRNHSDFRDAFDISMDALFQRVANLRAKKT